MNRSNNPCPPYSRDCNCCKCVKGNLPPNGGRGGKYAESSPNEDDEDEDGYCSHNSRKCDKFAREDDLCDNLIDLIDDQMISTMSSLRRKARKFMKSELEQSFSSETTCRPCTCPEEIRSRGTKLSEKANGINYKPKSAFLKKMVKEYRQYRSDCSEGDESDSARSRGGRRSNSRTRQVSNVRISPNVEEYEDSPGLCCCCPQPCLSGENVFSPTKERKSQHVSRSKKKKWRGKRKRLSGGANDLFEPNLKQPHENSCERCWRFASPSRSPVNKPDQRFDPNFRRGHSATSLNPEKAGEEEDFTCPCRLTEPPEAPPDVQNNVPSPSILRKPIIKPSQSIPCENYAPQHTSFSERRGIPCGSQPVEPSNRCTSVKELDFDYLNINRPDPLSVARRNSPRSLPCGGPKQNESLEKGVVYSSKVQRFRFKPPTVIPSTCKHFNEEGRRVSLPFGEVCGRLKPENLHPSMRGNFKDPCRKKSKQNISGQSVSAQDTSVNRGSGSRGSGLGSNSMRVLEMGEGALNQSVQIDTANSKSAQQISENSMERKNRSPKVKDKSKTKSPKSKSPNGKSPNGKSPNSKSSKSPQAGRKTDARKDCSTNEAPAYFKMPPGPTTPDQCGSQYVVLKCRCHPTSTDGPREEYCCHCGFNPDETDVKFKTRVCPDVLGRFTVVKGSPSPLRPTLQNAPAAPEPRPCSSPLRPALRNSPAAPEPHPCSSPLRPVLRNSPAAPEPHPCSSPLCPALVNPPAAPEPHPCSSPLRPVLRNSPAAPEPRPCSSPLCPALVNPPAAPEPRPCSSPLCPTLVNPPAAPDPRPCSSPLRPTLQNPPAAPGSRYCSPPLPPTYQNPPAAPGPRYCSSPLPPNHQNPPLAPGPHACSSPNAQKTISNIDERPEAPVDSRAGSCQYRNVTNNSVLNNCMVANESRLQGRSRSSPRNRCRNSKGVDVNDSFSMQVNTSYRSDYWNASHGNGNNPCANVCANVSHRNENVPCANVSHRNENVPCANVSHRSENVPCANVSHRNENVPCANVSHRNENVPCANVSHRNENSACANVSHRSGTMPFIDVNHENGSYSTEWVNIAQVCNNSNANASGGNAMHARNVSAAWGNTHENVNCTANGNTSWRSGHGNLPFRNENAGTAYTPLNKNHSNNGQADTSQNFVSPEDMDTWYGMQYPRKYCVMYMTKGKENSGDDVEVLIEELSQPCRKEKDGRMADVSKKMSRVFDCPDESMALRFQKGVSEKRKTPQKSRVLYF